MGLSVYPSIAARQRLSKTFPRQREIVGDVVFYAVHVVSKESLWVCLCILLSLLGNGSVNKFPRQRGIVGDVVFYEVHVVSKETMRLFLTRTSCYFTSLSSRRLLGIPVWARRNVRSKQTTVGEPVRCPSYAYCM
jgi:hypothetical protein